MKVYPRYESRLEPCDDYYYGSTTIALTLFDDKAVLETPFMDLEMPYTEKNARALVEIIKLFVERVEIEEERARLLP